MKPTDYLNSPDGQRLVVIYGGLLAIINVNVGFLVAWLKSPDGKFPEGWSTVVLALIAAAVGTAFVMKKPE